MKSFFTICFIICCACGLSAQQVDIYKKFFPDPAYKMPVPIISGDSSINYYTSYNDAVKFLKNLQAKHKDIMKIGSIGKTQLGRDELSVTLTSNNKDNKKLRVIFMGCMHGNEPIATDGMLYLIYKLTEDPAYADLLNQLEIQIIPMVNADGRQADRRASSTGVDLNRDLNTQRAVESRNIKNAVNLFNPQVVVDFHEFNPNRSDYEELSDCYTVGYDVMFLYTGSLTVDPAIRKMIAEDFAEPTKAYLVQNHREVTDYASTIRKGKEILLNKGGIASRSSATNYALQNRISLLMEIRGVTEKGKAVKRRIETSFLCATSYLKIAREKKDKIMETIDAANNRSIKGTGKIVVTSKYGTQMKPFLFVDECKGEHKTVDFNTRNNNDQKPIITRERPGAYVIYPCSDAVKNILITSGVKIKELTASQDMNIDSYSEQASKDFTLSNGNKSIPKGAVIIETAQQMSNAIFNLLEPEGKDSLYTNGFIKKEGKDKTLTLYRISPEQLLKITNKKDL
jgi:hypothetical protein